MAGNPKTVAQAVDDLAIKNDAPARAASKANLQGSNTDKSKKKKQRGIGAKILPLFLLLLLIAAMVGVLIYNVFDIREKYLRSTIDKIPIISGLLLAPPIDEFKDLDRDGLIARIKKLEQDIENADTTVADKDRMIDTYLQEIENLKVFEDQHLEFLEDRAAFEKMVAEGDPEAYASFYESVWPESAAELYANALGTVMSSTEWKKYINKIASMDETSAAKMLEELIPSDMPIVVDILRNLKEERAAEIMSAMDIQLGAAVLKQMYPS